MLPIVAYGSPILRKKSENISPDYSGLNELIDKMFETMYTSNGVGLSAPQVNKSIRLFVVGASHYGDEYEEAKDFVKVFINPAIIEEFGEEWTFNESCLSVPGINEDVIRKSKVKIEYLDRNFNKHIETYKGIIARIIQHECEHLEGIIFVDRLSGLKKTLLKGKLQKISKGITDTKYKMLFPNVKRR